MIETVTKISGNSTSTNKMRHNTAQLSQVEVMLLCVTHLLLNKVTTTKWMMSSRSFGQFVLFVSVVILNMFWKCNLMWWNSDSDLTKWKWGTGRKAQWQKEQHAKKPTEMNTTHLEWFQLHPSYLVSQQRPGLKNFLGLVFLFDRKKRLEEFRRLWGEDFKGAGNKKGRTLWNQPCMGTFGVNSEVRTERFHTRASCEVTWALLFYGCGTKGAVLWITVGAVHTVTVILWLQSQQTTVITQMYSCMTVTENVEQEAQRTLQSSSSQPVRSVLLHKDWRTRNRTVKWCV